MAMNSLVKFPRKVLQSFLWITEPVLRMSSTIDKNSVMGILKKKVFDSRAQRKIKMLLKQDELVIKLAQSALLQLSNILS